jgi:hypothetical protein
MKYIPLLFTPLHSSSFLSSISSSLHCPTPHSYLSISFLSISFNPIPYCFIQLLSESKRGCPSEHSNSSISFSLRVFSSVVCQGVTTVAYIPMASFLEIVGETGLKELRHAVYLRQQQALLGGGQVHASMKPRRSIFSMPDRLELTKKVRHAKLCRIVFI